ncbi:hypothetical protein N7519_010037 [Penicillium mononematosum]|uniref:uncharacterized protein n=1 Tax=Penicillium mononematosum TaxID=268346 RepID=UPI0025475BFB|nr:uncharacterized protein N7519_010037 [Penicillium mononematosum]KAJ6179576.1 hypothetical protein N7519_010037 [Penicillium mononematosum]
MAKRIMRYDSHKQTKLKSTRNKVDDDDDEKQLKAAQKKVEKEEENQKGIHIELHWSPGHSDMATFQGTRLLMTCPGARSRTLTCLVLLGQKDAEIVVYASYVGVAFDSDGNLIQPTNGVKLADENATKPMS